MPNLTSPGKLYLELKSRDEIANLTAGEILVQSYLRSDVALALHHLHHFKPWPEHDHGKDESVGVRLDS